MRSNNSVVAIIPARGGSKGLPGKNLADLNGQPLIAYSIQDAKNSQRVERVIVSTDDQEICDAAKVWGAEVVLRPPELATDEASTDSVLEHALLHLEKTEGFRPDLVVLLQPTSPIRSAGLVDACISQLESTQSDSLLTVFEGHHFFWRRNSNGLHANYDTSNRPRRQDILEDERIMLENGSVYVTRRDVLLESHSRLAGKIEWFVMNTEDSIEIDSSAHLSIARSILSNRTSSPENQALLDGVSLVVLDFDGVLTDNKVWISETGQEMVMNNRIDGMGLSMLRDHGIEVFVLSSEINNVVAERCRKLGLSFRQGLTDKSAELRSVADQYGIELSQVAYLGNDVNDLACMRIVGCSVAVADAHQTVIEEADIILAKTGGNGAVRELCDLVLSRQSITADSRG